MANINRSQAVDNNLTASGLRPLAPLLPWIVSREIHRLIL